jgi:hypothetical protein
MIGPGKIGELRDVLVTEKQNVAFQDLTLILCKGTLKIQFEIDDRIHWFCLKCEDEGLIDGWQGLIWDMSDGTIH